MTTTELFNTLAVAAAAKLLESGETTLPMDEPSGHFITTETVPPGGIEVASFDYENDGVKTHLTIYMVNGEVH